MKYVWDNRLSIRLDLGGAHPINEQFKLNLSNKSHLAAQLLLYDRVVIQTKDFGIVPILAQWCGIDGLLILLENNALFFMWQELHISYAKNLGLTRSAIDRPPTGWENWQQAAMWGEFEESVEAQVNNSIPGLSHQQKSHIIAQVVNNSIRAPGTNFESIKNETNQDLSTNISLNHMLHSFEESDKQPVNLNQLSGIGSDQLRIVHNKGINDAIDLYLNIADVNKNILMASSIVDCDLSMPKGTDLLLKSKLLRNHASPELVDQFISMLSLAEIPDIRPAIGNGEISFSDIIKLRNKYRSRQFRYWIHGKEVADARDLSQAYIRSLRSLDRLNLPKRILKFLATKAVETLNPIECFGSEIIESSFVDKWFHGYTPTLFLSEIESLPIDDYRCKDL